MDGAALQGRRAQLRAPKGEEGARGGQTERSLDRLLGLFLLLVQRHQTFGPRVKHAALVQILP